MNLNSLCFCLNCIFFLPVKSSLLHWISSSDTRLTILDHFGIKWSFLKKVNGNLILFLFKNLNLALGNSDICPSFEFLENCGLLSRTFFTLFYWWSFGNKYIKSRYYYTVTKHTVFFHIALRIKFKKVMICVWFVCREKKRLLRNKKEGGATYII